ncbi:unnamed protein product [Cunninghamella echinulata]
MCCKNNEIITLIFRTLLSRHNNEKNQNLNTVYSTSSSLLPQYLLTMNDPLFLSVSSVSTLTSSTPENNKKIINWYFCPYCQTAFSSKKLHAKYDSICQSIQQQQINKYYQFVFQEKENIN